MKVTNTGSNVLGFSIGGTSYTLAPGASQNLNDKYTEEALTVVATLPALAIDYEERVIEVGLGCDVQGVDTPILLDDVTPTYPDGKNSVLLVASSGGAVDVLDIGVGAFNGQRVTLIGDSDIDYPVLKNGLALSMYGAIELKQDIAVDFVWIVNRFICIGRSI